MKEMKRFVIIMAFIITAMLIIPLLTVNTIKAEAGMLVALVLFFGLNPIVSVCVGILSGQSIKYFWYTPILTATLFWVFSSFTYQTAFPVVYSAVYFVICLISMLITCIIKKTKK